jgi:hypothetical protein
LWYIICVKLHDFLSEPEKWQEPVGHGFFVLQLQSQG